MYINIQREAKAEREREGARENERGRWIRDGERKREME